MARDRFTAVRLLYSMQRHPVVMAFIGRHVLTGAVEGARHGYRTTRSELGAVVPLNVTDAVLGELRAGGSAP